MKRLILSGLFLAVVFVALLWAQKPGITYSKRWEKVEQLADKQLPESAIKEVESILAQARKENNSVQTIKAIVYKMRFTLEKDPDKAPAMLREFEDFATKSTDPAERALLHSMLAEIYAQHYQMNRWNIDRRTVVTGFMPDDINEWSKNIYFEKIIRLIDISIGNPQALQKVNTLKFAELIEKGDDSRVMQPTLFDFIGYRNIEVVKSITQASDIRNPLELPGYFAEATDFIAMKSDTAFEKTPENAILATYRQLIAFNLSKNNIPGLLYVDLQRLQYVRQHSNAGNAGDLYLNSLNSLIEKFQSNEAVVEALAEKANYYLHSSYEPDNKAYKRTAYDITAAGIKRFPNYKRIGLLRNIQNNITQKSLNVSHAQTVTPSSEFQLKINSANVTNLQISVFRINATALEYFNYRKNMKNEGKPYPMRTLQEKHEMKITRDPNFGQTDTVFKLVSKSYGIYEVVVNETGGSIEKPSNTVFVVSDFGFMARSTKSKEQNLYVLNRKTGTQQSGVQVSIYEQKWMGSGYNLELRHQAKTDNAGLYKYPFDTNYREVKIFLAKGDDRYFSSISYPHSNNYNPDNTERAQLSLLTDRSIYRPGQTVYFKGIAWFASKNRQEASKNSAYEVALYDANNKMLTSKRFRTNEFGSFSGEFILPESGLNGAFRLQSGDFSQTIWVEEYKRPTFEVLIEKPKEEIRFGEKVVFKGNVKAYAGYPVAGAEVKYRVVRRTHRFWWWWNEPEKEVINGTIVSDDKGNFEVTFVPEKQKSSTGLWRESYYNYTLYANATDTKGETQPGSQTVPVGDKSLFIIADVPERIEKNTIVKLPVSTETLNGEKRNSAISYEVFRLEEKGEFIGNIKEDAEKNTAESVASGRFNTSEGSLALDMKAWKSARYKLMLTTRDAWGNEVKSEHKFVVYDKNDKRPPIKTYEWLLPDKTEYAVGENAIIRFGTTVENASVLYEVMQGATILESRWIPFSNEIKSFEIPFKESYGPGVTVMFTFMRDERLFSKQIQITRKTIAKKLTPTFSVFRDKLLPGEKAEWTVTIPESGKNKKPAELLVAMYDASLDAIRPHNWAFNPVYYQNVAPSPRWVSNAFNDNMGHVAFKSSPHFHVKEYNFDNLNWFGFTLGQNNRTVRIRGMAKSASKSRTTELIEVEEDVVYSIVTSAPDVMNKVMEAAPDLTAIKPRTNFNETAFFYPQLRTDEKGNVKFSFTVPESLTRWNVKLLAHSADLYFGTADTQVVTQKDLMVQMNLPRFVRRSDKLVLSANVINLIDKDLKANVEFELIDPATNKVISKQAKTASLSPGKGAGSASEITPLSSRRGGGGEVEFELTGFSSYELIICKVVARAGNFSDGEQKYLPVLPDKILLTESMPLTIRGNQSRTFNFENLLKNGSKAENRGLTVEFSSNPAWYAVQALPVLSQPAADNAMDYFTAYYANSLAAFIANSNPKIAETFDRWKKEGGSRAALLSNLEKNSELKNMLLEETPWVMAAQNETEQKQRIALLFDLNMQKNQSQQYLDKLISLQMPSGGFAWFAGMPESRYITQEIVLNLARLKKMAGSNTLPSAAVEKALNYLDLEISRDFAELKKHNKDYQKTNSVGNMQLFYLHMRSEYPEIPVHASARDAVKFYTGQAEKYWTDFTLYGKAMMALVAHRIGNSVVAGEILKSLRENALKTDEFGMYWARNTAGFFWNERPVAVQAAIIEAFAEISNSTAEVDEMKIWLLKQKQTQRWDSPVATVNAIYALLNRGSDWLANSGQVRIELGNKTLQPAEKEAGTGYFKETIAPADIRRETGKVTVTKSDSGIGWGAMYWQYYQDLDKVEGHGGPLKVSKKLFVEKMSASGKTMQPIEQANLKKGDKVITRLVITTDRNLEFVALKDLRAACFEPVVQVSGTAWKENVAYYHTTKDASTQFFFSFLPKGTYVFEYELWVNNSGTFTSGITSVQCQYAPEFVSHTGGEKIKIN